MGEEGAPAATAYRVRAYNTATASSNRIHADDVARAYGFRGGLVPGVDVYAYLTHPAAARWGLDWLARGTMSARFLRPVYDGEDTCVTCGPAAPGTAGGAGGDCVELSVHTAADPGTVCAVATAGLPPGAPATVDAGRWPVAPLPDPPPPASEAALRAADPLGTVALGFHADRAHEYLDDVRETLPLYREAGVAHPGWLLRMANAILAANVVLGPWIHVSSDVRHLGLVRDGDRVAARGRVTEVFERKGHRFVTLDVLLVAGDDRPVAHVEHTAIFEPRREAP